MIQCRIRTPKLTPLEEAYNSMKEVAQRHGKQFDITLEQFAPIWTKLDETRKSRKTIKKLGQIND